MFVDVQWHGPDGSVWYLTDPTSPVRLMPGLRGLEAPTIDRWTSEAPGLAGNRYRGHRAKAREVFLPVYLRGASSADWLAAKRAWHASLDPDLEGTLVVTLAGQRRYLPCRWVATEQGWAHDPLLAAKSLFGEYLEASGVYWLADAIVRSWTAEAPNEFFMSGGGVFFVSASNTIGDAVIDNPGDVPAWPVWTLNGPFDTATISVDDATIEVPFAVGSGEWLRIDTRPDRQSVTDDTGTDRVADLGSITFASIPAGSSVSLGLSATGTGTGFLVTAELTPQFRRAW